MTQRSPRQRDLGNQNFATKISKRLFVNKEARGKRRGRNFLEGDTYIYFNTMVTLLADANANFFGYCTTS